jgi:hypothetical protein
VAVAEKVLSNGLEGAVLLLKRRHDILGKQIRARGQRDWVRNGGLEAVGVGFDGLEGLVGGGRGNRLEGFDEGIDGGELLGQVGIGSEELVIFGNDALSTVSGQLAPKQTQGRARERTYSKLEMSGAGRAVPGSCSDAAAHQSLLLPLTDLQLDLDLDLRVGESVVIIAIDLTA